MLQRKILYPTKPLIMSDSKIKTLQPSLRSFSYNEEVKPEKKTMSWDSHIRKREKRSNLQGYQIFDFLLEHMRTPQHNSE